ncbi:unnamed protein product [Pseudo-nitzschia multistriata]|uniref:Uncharacterized protein n=1 Tax=Pseudo-nitzschia multistriata TaxID=183589 RepID=A0A448ZD51_9STRA|nr:unnamed protein product [Pseudo-nitzschia multistriata]
MTLPSPIPRPQHYQPAAASVLNQFRKWRSKIGLVWSCHFTASILLLVCGSSYYSEDRKYVPIDASVASVALGGNTKCFKAYANVLASGINDDGAIICCTAQEESNDGICHPTPWYLFFATRLVKLPEAWLIPVFPLVLRGLVQLITRRSGAGTAASSSDGAETKRQRQINRFAMRRFWLYFGLIQLRGWVLYLLFDTIENHVVEPAGDSCWYDNMSRGNQGSCSGKATDFSDHVVLFFAQILPITLTEVLFSFVAPFWRGDETLRKIVPTLLVAALLYLYGISFLKIYKTAVYFHTQLEIIIGYLITLIVQIPLFLVLNTSLLLPTRDYFFGPGN